MRQRTHDRYRVIAVGEDRELHRHRGRRRRVDADRVAVGIEEDGHTTRADGLRTKTRHIDELDDTTDFTQQVTAQSAGHIQVRVGSFESVLAQRQGEAECNRRNRCGVRTDDVVYRPQR